MRGRIPKPWFRADRGAWYVVLNGSRVPLGKGKAEAFRRYHELLAGQSLPKAEPGFGSGQTFDHLAGLYLDDFRRRAGSRTHYVAACYLNPIRAAVGRVPAGRVRKADIDAAVRRHGRWNPTTEHHVRSRVLAVFNWAVARDILPVNPVRGLWKPRPLTRGAAALVSDAHHAALMTAAPAYLRDVLFALQQTGCRPCEVLTVTAADLDPAAGAWVLADHKTAKATGRPRVVFLSAELSELCGRLAARHSTGPLFRRASGKPFPPAYYLPKLVRTLRRKLGLPEGITPYGYRHTFATDALAAGVPDAQVAELLGHAGTAVLHRHYAHLGARAAALRAALDRVRGG